MATHRVVCVNKAPTFGINPHEHSTHLGLGSTSGYQPRVSVPEAVRQIQSPGGNRYYTGSSSTGVRA
ncbi:MAG: hypothetical protein ACYDAG_12920 [Chloroflexota bacterium]